MPAGTVIESVDVADPPDVGVTELELNVTVHPAGDVAVNATALLKVLSEFTVSVETFADPALIVRAEGAVEIEKSGVTTDE